MSRQNLGNIKLVGVFATALRLFPCCLLLAACTNNRVADIPCDFSGVSYQLDIAPIITRACSDPKAGDCHQTNSFNGDLTTYAGVKEAVDSLTFRDRVVLKKDMPPDFSKGAKNLSVCEIEKIETWLNDGAPQN